MQNNAFHILIVDDSTTFTQILNSIISRNFPALYVRTAASGMEAIRILGNNEIELVLMDVFMPVFDGIEMAKIIRSNEKTSKIPIIFVTGSDPDDELMQKAIEIGGIDYLKKSLNEEEIVRTLSLYLRFMKWEREVNNTLQENIKKLNAEIKLREKVERKLIELTSRLHEANSSKDKFFSIIAHDLKNPLSSFRNAAKLLESEYMDMNSAELGEFLTMLKLSSDGLYALLENLLIWSRAQTGALQPNFVKFNLKNLVDEIYSTTFSMANDKKIKLLVNIPDNIVLNADSNMIGTVIRNLTTNAVKFTNFYGKVNISAAIDNKFAEISVSDNGVGMSADDIEKLFKIGVGNSSKLGTNRETGTGLGLIICYDFLKLNSSELKVTSTENIGTTFSFKLPLA